MAYKFQIGPAELSGSLTHAVPGTGTDASTGITLENDQGGRLAIMSASGEISASAGLSVGGAVRLDGVADTAAAVAADSFYFLDADGFMKRERMSDYATAIAGDGLAASSGVLAVGVDDSTIELDSDALRLKDDGVTGAKLAPAVAGYGLAQDGSGNLDVDLNELTAEAIASGDFLAFVDSTDNGTHKESVDDLATLFAGVGLSAASAVLALDLNELSAATVDVGNDSIAIIDANDSNASRKESIADVMTAAAGDGLAASAGVLSVSLSELTDAAVNVAADSLIFIDADGNVTRKDTFADYAAALVNSEPGFGSAAGKIQFDPNSLAAASIASGDSMILVDANDSNIPKKETIDDIATLFAGPGLTANSAVLGVVNAANGGLDVQADSVALDINDLGAAAIDVAADFIAFSDEGTAGDPTKKVSVANLATAMAGAGITATNGVLSIDGSTPNGVGDENATLVEGFNFGNATLTANRTWTLPASPSDGDVVRVKAPANVATFKVIISKAGSQTIDGQTTIELETAGAAVSLIYLGGNAWGIF